MRHTPRRLTSTIRFRPEVNNPFGGTISFAGSSHNLTATADSEIPAGRVVKVVAVAGTNLVVAPAPVASSEGARSDA